MTIKDIAPVLDTPPEERFDRITRLATELLDVSIAHVSFLDENREWLKSSCGWDGCEMSQMCFHASRSLKGPGGHRVGTFSIADPLPRELNERDARIFDLLVEMIEHELGLFDMIHLQLDVIMAKAEAERAHHDRVAALNALVRSRQRLSEEVGKAARYVESLLPDPLPVDSGPVGAEWVFIPSEELGGDAFGYHWLDEDHFALYLLDVSGHGFGVALHSVSLLNVLRTQALPHADFYDPSIVLATLNEAFQMKQYSGMFFTIWYGVYDRSTRQLTYASGGHPPALLVTDSDGGPHVKRLRTPGLLIGGQSNVVYPKATRTLPEGSVLYLFSDGVYEVPRSDGSMMDLDDFIDIVTEHVTAGRYDLQPIVDRIEEIRSCKTCSDDFALLRFVFN